jgi:hypothetical protein
MQRSGAVQLRLAGNRSHAVLRELHGTHEHAVDGTTTAAAIRLLDGLLLDDDGSALPPGCARELTAADRDRLLAWVYADTFGRRIESTVCCRACEEAFELDFDLGELIARLEDEAGAPPDGGQVELGDGVTARIPTGADELAITGLPVAQAEDALARRCAVDDGPAPDPAALGAALEAVAPVADLDLDATCPECGEAQLVHFDLQAYLLESIAADRARLMRDVHALACAYGWGLEAILALSRRERRALATLAEAHGVRRERSLA